MKFKLDIFDTTNIFHHKWETEAECSSGVSYVRILIIHIHIYCLFIPQTALSEKDLSHIFLTANPAMRLTSSQGDVSGIDRYNSQVILFSIIDVMGCRCSGRN